MKVRVSLLMIVLLLMQMVLPGVAPLQTASSEKDNVQNELFDFDSLSDDSYEEEDGHALELELDLPAEVEEVEVEEEVVEEPKKENLEIKTFNTNAYEDLGNIFTFKSLKIDDEYIKDGDIIEIEAGTVAQLDFTWNTEGLGAKAGDTATIYLSDAFLMVTTPEERILVDGIDVGTYHVENGVLKFEFNENIEDDDVQNGFVNLGLEFNLDKFRENIKQEIPFNDRDENSITVIAKPNTNHSGIAKEGHPDSWHDAREITWTIDVINTNDEEITDAFLADNIPEGLGTARDFVIHELSVGFDGDLRDGTDVTSTINPTGFPIEFDAIAPFRGYRVQYKTTIIDYGADSFTNDATFAYGDTELPADATVGGLTRSNPIEKNGSQVGNTDRIQWQIDVNKNGSIISEAIVVDELPDGLTIDPNSIAVVRITQSGGNWDKGDPHETSFEEFPMNLGALGQEDAYRIKFETVVDWGEVDSGEYSEKNGFENEATLYDGEDELNTDDATVTIERGPILEKVEIGNVNYEKRTITWEVTVNKEKHPLGDVTVTDILPEGLYLVAGDINIKGDEETNFSSITPSIDTTNDGLNDGKTKLTLNLTDVGTETITIVYTTSIDNFKSNSFTNTVGMTGEGVGEGGEDREVTIRPNANTYTKSHVGIDYNAKTMDWRLNVNPIREDINSGFVITDTFTNDGLILLPDTVVIQLGGDTLEAGGDYVLAPIDEGYQNGFTITFNRKIADGELVVKYTTSYDPQQEVDGKFLKPHSNEKEKEKAVYRNKAEFDGETENGHLIKKDANASHKVREDSWNSGKKEGQLVRFDDEANVVNGWASGAERKIAWQLYINYQEQNLGTGVVVTDKLDYAGEIDEGSIKVSVYDVEPDGTTEITGSVLDPSSYTLNVDGDQFTLTFVNEVTKRYVIEFTTSVPDISKHIYTNKATVTADDVDYDYSATVIYNQHNNFLAKGANQNQAYTGDEIKWEVKVNESLSIIKNAVITDKISAGHVYLEGSLKIYKSQDPDKALEEGTDYTLDVVPVTDENDELTGATNLVIKMEGALQDTLVLKYTTVVTETNGTISNDISLEGTAFEQKSVESAKINARQFANVGGEWSQSRGAIRLTKIDAETNETITNNEATFQLWYELNGEKQRFGEEEYTTENGVLEIGNLPFRTYYLREVTAPDGYVLLEDEDDWLEIVVDTAIGNDQNNPTFAEKDFKNTKEKIDITGTKNWIGGEVQRPDSIKLQLYQDNEPYGDPVPLDGTEETPWQYTWTNLDKTNIDGKEYEYTIDEVDIPANFVQKISKDGLTITITNEFVSPLIDIPVEKVWLDNNDATKDRPDSIIVELTRSLDGELDEEFTPRHATVKADQDGNWTYEFTGLAQFNENGVEYTYEVEELNVPEEYASSVRGHKITNLRAGTITIDGTKTWLDNNAIEVRPDSITVELTRSVDGELDEEFTPRHATVKADQDGNWTYEFTGLAQFDENGVEYTYEVEELNVPEEYASSVNGHNITNLRVGTITVEGTKTWLDGNHPDRPTSIEVILNQNGSEVARETVTAADNWSYRFNGLDQFNEEGVAYEYTVEEEIVSGYQVSYDDNYNVINTLLRDIDVDKTWLDNSDAAGDRPEEIIVSLYQNGTHLADEDVTITAGEGWSHTFTNLPAYDENDELIDYTVTESYDTENYRLLATNGDMDTGFELVNVRLMDIDVTKSWQDDNLEDRPDTITVNLLQNGTVFVEDQEVTPNADGDWTYIFTGLAEFDADGVAYDYTVSEHDVPGYNSEVQGYEITNTRSEERDITVTKSWLDDDSADRPIEITIDLLRNGEVDQTVQVTGEDDWSYVFENLPAFDDEGQAIAYSIEEHEVEGYQTTINGFDLTNLRVGTVEFEGTKTWLDNNDATGDRPEEIDVIIFQNDVEIDRQTVSANSDWGYSFKDLAEFDDQGVKYSYSVAEELADEVRDLYEEISEPNSYDLINRRVGLIDVDVTKTWQDDDLTDRPEAITVNLLQNGIVIDTQNITAEMDWSFSFTELAEFDEQGVAYEYTISEHDVPGYQSVIDGYEITNTRSELKSITVTKSWLDNDSSARPNEITVDLLANGEIIQTVQITAATDWAYQFENLPAYDEQGKAIVYSIMEHEVEGYETTIDGFDITNRSVKEDATDGLSSEQDNEGQTMPKTATAIYNTLLISLVFLLAGVALFIINKRRNRSSN